MSFTADQLIVIGRGRIVSQGPGQEVIDSATHSSVRVRSPQATDLAAALQRDGVTVTSLEPSLLDVSGLEAPQVGEAAAAAGIEIGRASCRERMQCTDSGGAGNEM